MLSNNYLVNYISCNVKILKNTVFFNYNFFTIKKQISWENLVNYVTCNVKIL